MAVVAIGGGKGGVGRSLVASGLAVFIAQLGRKVLLVDGHPCAPHLARTFGVVRTDGLLPPWAVAVGSPRGDEGIVPNVRVLSAHSELGAVEGVSLRHPREIADAAGADHVLLDLGPGVTAATLDAMLDADGMVLVTTPEPAAIEAVYRFLRHAYARSLSQALRALPPARAALRAAVRNSYGPEVPVRLAESIARVSGEAADAAWATLRKLRALLVVNASRSRADLDLGEAMAVVAQQQLGISVEYLGHIEADEAVVLAARRRRPLLVDVPAAKASRNLERIARRLLSLEAGRGEHHPARDSVAPPDGMTHYEALALDRGASDEEIRRAYRRMREIYGSESLVTSGLLNEAENASVVARIEEARDVLLDPARRRPYDLSIGSSGPAYASEPPPEMPPEGDEPVPMNLPEVTPETEFSGALLRSIREARGADLKDVAARTKISVANLRALENEEYDALPAVVYLRGFVAEVAKFLRLDVEQVTRTYLRRARRALAATARSRT